MLVINTRNVQQVLPRALYTLFTEGVKRDSRNGPVLQHPTPVTTVYERPWERVIFWKERDANPFFHLYESLWMLAGRNDVAGPRRYADNMKNYSDDGETFHGAYGHRWRRAFATSPSNGAPADQLSIIAESLKKNPEDRRCVLQMWSSLRDLGGSGKDVPCNTMATFQIAPDGKLDLTLFCRSNDMVWGAYGANAVHFSFLLEYMAGWIGVPQGHLYQISVNWHGYVNVLDKVKALGNGFHKYYGIGETPGVVLRDNDPYSMDEVVSHSMFTDTSIEEVDRQINELLFRADHGYEIQGEWHTTNLFWENADRMMFAHHVYKTQKNVDAALHYLNDPKSDWMKAGREWLERRRK
jgi:thymidylate synthase